MSEQASIAPGAPLADIDIAGILRLLPHRHPFVLVDRVTRLTAFQRCVAIKNVTINEPFFPGHFPSDPIMPGVLQIEAMAQAAALLVMASMGERHAGSRVYFMSVENARFRRPVRPGDRLHLDVTVLRSKLGVWKFAGKGLVEDEVVAEAEFAAKLMSP